MQKRNTQVLISYLLYDTINVRKGLVCKPNSMIMWLIYQVNQG